jgi:hypothetical protein
MASASQRGAERGGVACFGGEGRPFRCGDPCGGGGGVGALQVGRGARWRAGAVSEVMVVVVGVAYGGGVVRAGVGRR